MTTYTAHFRSRLQQGWRKFDADTPEQALTLARRLAAKDPEDRDGLVLEFFNARESFIDRIVIRDEDRRALIEWIDEDGSELIAWLDDERRLRIAAQDLLDAAELVVARWERGDLAAAVRQLNAAIAKAKGGAP